MLCVYCGKEIRRLADVPASEQISFRVKGYRPKYSYHTRCDRPYLENLCSSPVVPMGLDDLERLVYDQ